MSRGDELPPDLAGSNVAWKQPRGQLRRAKKAAGVKRGTLHSFRHFFVSTMANANVSPFKVMKIVGHRSLDIILTYYHASEGELLGAVDFARVLTKEKNEK